MMLDTYSQVSYRAARLLTLRYSNSFGLSSRVFDARVRPHIYAIYGLVRIADEVVDVYRGGDTRILLDDLERETYAAIERQYSTNPIVHAFALTAHHWGITRELIEPFFASMRSDIDPDKLTYSEAQYRAYIYGSAEVVGLMCLKVFCEGDDELYEKLRPGAQALGAAYQKVNFLRDFAEDYRTLNRVYFPGVTYESFDDAAKSAIIADIKSDFSSARSAIDRLPASARAAVATSYIYYYELLKKLASTPAETIRHERVRITNAHKIWLLAKTYTSQGRLQ